MTWITMSSYRTRLPSFHFHMRQFFPCNKISYFKSQQAVYGYISDRFSAIDGKRANKIAEGTHLIHQLIFLCVGYIQQGRRDVVEINIFSIGPVNGIMCPLVN